MTCSNCNFLEEIEKFQSILHYEKFVKWLQQHIDDNTLNEISVKWNYGLKLWAQIEKGIAPYEPSRGYYTEKWYQCKECNDIWRLVKPIPEDRFFGVFEIFNEEKEMTKPEAGEGLGVIEK